MSEVHDLGSFKEARNNIKELTEFENNLANFVNSLYYCTKWNRQVWTVIEEIESLRIEVLILIDYYTVILNSKAKRSNKLFIKD